jgi:hypothetical protein
MGSHVCLNAKPIAVTCRHLSELGAAFPESRLALRLSLMKDNSRDKETKAGSKAGGKDWTGREVHAKEAKERSLSASGPYA